METVRKDVGILSVYLDRHSRQCIEIPVTPDTSAADVVACTANDGDHRQLVELWRGTERIIDAQERIQPILYKWHGHEDQVCFYLTPKHQPYESQQAAPEEPPAHRMPTRVDMTLSELQEMAARQQQQIDQNQQMLVAKDQRLNFLKQQEQRHLQIAGENDRLRKLRERVGAQETKLKRLRSLRREVNTTVSTNGTLAEDLDSVRSLFHVKEKELVSAVGKVEQLTRQLDELRRGNDTTDGARTSEPLIELEKLRKELAMRNKVNEQQNSKLAAHREVLQQRKDEMTRLDRKVAELKTRIKNKKPGTKDNYGQSPIAAVEPYMKQPPVEHDDAKLTKDDPKYQTLPRGIKFNQDSPRKAAEGKDAVDGRASSVEPVMRQRPGSAQSGMMSSKTHPPSYNAVMGIAAQQGSQSSFFGRQMPQPPNTAATVPLTFANVPPSTRISSLMTNFAPRPYGSTFSSSVLGSRMTPVPVPDMPPSSSQAPASVPDSSVLSTPNHSISLPMTSTPVTGSEPAATPSSSVGNYTRPTTSPPSPSTTTEATKTPMYASKSVIANTYMRKLGPSALEKYRNSMSQIYQGFTPGLVSGDSIKDQSPTATVAPLNVQADQTWNKPDTNQYNIDPVKFRPNAPRIHRRRSSSGGESPHAEPRVAARVPTPQVVRESDDEPSPPPESKPNSSQSQPESPEKPKERQRLPLVLRRKKTNLRSKDAVKNSRRVSFDPLALLLDATLEGEMELVKKTAAEVSDPSCPNDEGITALHNAICAGHYDIVKFLVEFGCNVNAPDSDGWTPLHCAASCNSLAMVRVLVEHGACIFATTISDEETAAEKCEEDEDGYDGCSQYLYNIQEKLGILNAGIVYAVFDYQSENNDEISFSTNDKLTILRKGDATEPEWWWARRDNQEGYVPRNLLGLHSRAKPQWLDQPE